MEETLVLRVFYFLTVLGVVLYSVVFSPPQPPLGCCYMFSLAVVWVGWKVLSNIMPLPSPILAPILLYAAHCLAFA